MQRSRFAGSVRGLLLPLVLPLALAVVLWLLVNAGLRSDRVAAQQDAHNSTHAAARPGSAAPDLAAADVIIELSGFTFSPTVVTIEPGQTVTWVRRDGFHNVAADDGSYRSGAVSDSWDTFSHTFAAAGESLFHCEAHGSPGGGGMAGKVIVQASGQADETLYLPLFLQP